MVLPATSAGYRHVVVAVAEPAAHRTQAEAAAAGLELVMTVMAQRLAAGMSDELEAFARLTPASSAQTAPGPGHPRVERLLYAVRAAADASFEADVASSAAQQGVGSRQMLAGLMQLDPLLVQYVATAPVSAALQEQMAAAAWRQEPFCRAAVALMHADDLALLGTVMLRWNLLEPQADEASQALRYGRPDLVSQVLAGARAAALRNIAACQTAGIPCPSAVAMVEEGDSVRDGRAEDAVEAIAAYQAASLRAQTLRMLLASAADREESGR